MIDAWRIVDVEFADKAFTGDGSFAFDGRWHSAGTRMVYTAESFSLATLEVLVQIPDRRKFSNYVVISCSFPEVLVEELDISHLPADWFETPGPAALQRIGDLWIREKRSAVLRVPSAVTRIESNYLINPQHEDFASIDIGEPRPLDLDVRLVT